jgi:hypothetical protein
VPVSKKRKKATARRDTQPRRNPMQPRETEDQIAERTRAEFVDLTLTGGHLFPALVTYTPLGPPVECWTNAWNHAQARGLGYAEGIALMPNGWHAHAWCVTADGTVVEPTIGYDHATEYRGWILNTEGRVAVAALLSDEPRTSFLEAGLASGVATWEQIKARFITPHEPHHPAGT